MLSKIPDDGLVSIVAFRRDGFISSVGGHAAAAGASPGAADIVTTISATFNLVEAKRRSAGKIELFLGSARDSLAAAIECVKKVAEFVSRAAHAREF